MDDEVWADVTEYPDRFMISSFGRVWSKKSNKILAQGTSRSGYRVITSKIGGRKGKSVCLKVHRLVADAFLNPPSPELVTECSTTKYGVVPVNHKNGDKTDNHWANLEWISYSENSKHSVETGLSKYEHGTDHHLSVLTDDLIEKIREEYVPYSPTKGLRALCRKYNLKHNTVSNALRR